VYIRYFWQGNHQIYSHVRFIYIYIYLVLADPNHYVCSAGEEGLLILRTEILNVIASLVYPRKDVRRFQLLVCLMCRFGQNHIYTLCIPYFWQGNHQIYGHLRCIYTVLANPVDVVTCPKMVPQQRQLFLCTKAFKIDCSA